MQLKFDLADELDLTNELPDTLNAISTLLIALPYYRKHAGANDGQIMNASYFLACALDDVAEAIREYSDLKIKERKEARK